MTWITTRSFVAVLALVALAPGLAAAQTPYPNRPIRLIVPFAAGGSADVAARGVATALGERWGQQIVIENKAGANTQIGAEIVAKAEPDGYTLLWGSEATFVINPFLLRGKLRYDPAKDFVPITGTVAINQVLVVHPSVPARTFAEFVALAKAKPKTLNYGTVGFGSAAHLNTEQMDQLGGFHTVAIHYKGSGPALADVIAGHIQFALVSVWLARDPSQAGLVRPLAVGSPMRSREFPDLPTMDEAGLTGYDGSSWWGMFAPAGTPKDIVDRVNACIREVFDDPEFQKTFLVPNMLESRVTSPETFAASIQSGAAKWERIIGAANLRAEAPQ